MSFKINNFVIGKKRTFFIADIGANHDGNLNKALDLINLAHESGADAIKFQHFNADSIVSDFGFKSLKNKASHQSKWNKSVYQVYKDASINLEWTNKIKKECEKLGKIFFTSPYSLELVDYIDKYVGAYKIGSGDINWIEIIEKIAKKNKPTFIATGASTIAEVKLSIQKFMNLNKNICIMQCNTNYTGSKKNFKYVNLNVLKNYKTEFPKIVLGLSDHTPGHTTVLGAVAIGATVIEKHFTDNNNNTGPDHFFAINPKDWKRMVNETRLLEMSMGKYEKEIEHNEKETVILQRRSIRLKNDLKAGSKIKRNDLILLRPCPSDAITPDNIKLIIGRKLKRKIKSQEYLRWKDLN